MSLLFPATDLWRVGIINRPVASFLTRPLGDDAVFWLPAQPSFCFIADPFGIEHDGHNYIFAEAYDYRTKKGKIVYYEYSSELTLLRTGDALVKPFHLSYPFLLEHEGDIYMLPEAHRSGKLTLYRARRFPDDWEPVCDLLEEPAIDASVLQWQGMWWMFYALAGTGKQAMRELHVAYARQLTGPWQKHAHNPVHVSDASARMGGTPFIVDNVLHLPTQDCSRTYGGAVNILKVEALSPEKFACSVVQHLVPSAALLPYGDGVHTLSALGDKTLMDAKRISRSPARHGVNVQRRIRRLLGSQCNE